MVQEATLYIDRTSSQCSFCGKGADPREDYHKTYLGYDRNGTACGAKFTKVSTHYFGTENTVRLMRPDLEFVDCG